MNKSKVHNGNGTPASLLDWSTIQGFLESEFQGELGKLDSAVIFALIKLRSLIGRIKISPAKGAIARERLGSMHDTTYGRLSVAIDIMPLDVDLKTAYEAARTIPEIGGVGLYPDWLPYPGMHIDLRVRKSGGQLAQWSRFKLPDGSTVDKAITEAFV